MVSLGQDARAPREAHIYFHGGPLDFKRLARILFDVESTESIDLFTVFPWLKKFFRERRLHAAIRTIGDIIFTFIIVSGFLGPQDPKANISLFLSWGIWWPTVVLSWFFLGRMWCGFCPFPGMGRILQRLGLSLELKVPKVLQNRGVHWSVILLGLIIWFEESTNIKQSPMGTSVLLLAILGGATLSAMLFEKQAWCRYLCPMGRIIGVAATLSVTEFRPDHEKCKGCKTFACKRGMQDYPGCPVYLGAFNVRNNLYCLVCGHCLKLCDRDSPRLNVRSPFKELIINKGRFITCSYIIPFLMGSQLARFFQEGHAAQLAGCLESVTCNMGLFSTLLLLFFVLVFAVVKLGGLLFGITEDELFGRFSPMIPVFLPLAFTGELVYRLNYALEAAPDAVPTLGRQFGWDLSGYTFNLPGWLVPAMDVGVMAIGAMASLYILYNFVNYDFQSLVSNARYRACQAITIGMLGAYLYLQLAGV